MGCQVMTAQEKDKSRGIREVALHYPTKAIGCQVQLQ